MNASVRAKKAKKSPPEAVTTLNAQADGKQSTAQKIMELVASPSECEQSQVVKHAHLVSSRVLVPERMQAFEYLVVLSDSQLKRKADTRKELCL